MKCLSEFVLCFLSATEVFTTLTTNQEEEEDDPEVASAIVPEISVKKKNQPGCCNKAFYSFKETVPVFEELIHYPSLLQLSFKKYIYKLIRNITMENFFF